MTHNARYPDLLDFIVKGGTHQSFGTRLCSCFHALWNCTLPFIPTSSNQSKNPEHQQVSTDHHSRSSGYTPFDMVFDSPQEGIEGVYASICNICAARWNKKAHLSRVNDVPSNGVSHPAMVPSTNSCRYNKEHHCKPAQMWATGNSKFHHSTGCPVNPLSFHQKHKAWLHRQQLRTKMERAHRDCGMLSSPWTVFWLQIQTPLLFQFLYQYKCVESRRHNLPPSSLVNLSGWFGVFGVFAFLFAVLNLFHMWHGSTQSVWTVPSWVVWQAIIYYYSKLEVTPTRLYVLLNHKSYQHQNTNKNQNQVAKRLKLYQRRPQIA